MLNTQSLSLSSQCSPEIAQLGLDHVIDCLLRLAQIITHVVANFFTRNALPQVTSRVAGPRCAPRAQASGTEPGPLCAQGRAAKHGRHWASARRTATDQESRTDADGETDERGGQ